jgi:hypothetical protein
MRLLAILPILALAACSGGGDGTEITLNVNDPDGAFNASAAKDGTVAIKAGGFETSLKLPKMELDAGDFDINGVKLPQGSKIASFNIDGSPGDDKVRITFTSPVAPAAVVEHFRAGLNPQGFKLTAAGNMLSGTTDEGKPFKLETRAAGAGTEGVLTLS